MTLQYRRIVLYVLVIHAYSVTLVTSTLQREGSERARTAGVASFPSAIVAICRLQRKIIHTYLSDMVRWPDLCKRGDTSAL